MNKLIDRIICRFFTQYRLLDMLEWFSKVEDDLGPIFRLWHEDYDAARPIILRLWRRHPYTGICAIIDSIRYHYY